MINLMEHNKKTYKNLCKTLSKNNKCALVQATGTGKSYIASKYIEQHGDSALIIVPSNAIADAWSELLCDIEKEVEIITYQLFCKNPTKYIDYDIIIADEMHHLGSEVWGKNFIDTYLKMKNHKIIGLTATEIRYLDNSRNMAEELFDGIRVDGCDLPTAINNGVLPTFKYVSALYCKESDFEKWRTKTENIKNKDVRDKLKGELDFCVKNMVSVKQAIQENITDEYKKVIVFLNSVETKENAMDMFKNIFPKTNFYSCDYTDYSNSKKQLSTFKNDSSFCILFAIDMLNEGIHIDGVDCVIMFRKTESPQIYLQQLGRALSSSADKMPIIFDFVGNINNATSLIGREKNGIVGFITQNLSKEKSIIFKSYVTPISECLDKINVFYANYYTEEDIQFIISNYSKLGLTKVAEHLGRSKESVKDKAKQLGVTRKTKIPEDKIEEVVEMVRKYGYTKTANIYGYRVEGLKYFLKSRKYLKPGEIGRTTNYFQKDDRKEIVELLMNGYSVEEICKITGYERMKVENLRCRCKISTLSQIKKKEIEKNIIYDYKNGLKNLSKLSKKYGFVQSTISNILKRNGIAFENIYCSKKVVALDKDGKLYKAFDTMSSAAREIHPDNYKSGLTHISEAINGKCKTAYGYIWMCEEDYEKMLKEKTLRSNE